MLLKSLPAGVNPCALVALRLRLAGELDAFAVAADTHHRIVAPFPVTLIENKAVIAAQAGTRYEVLVDGSRILSVASRGRDELDLR